MIALSVTLPPFTWVIVFEGNGLRGYCICSRGIAGTALAQGAKTMTASATSSRGRMAPRGPRHAEVSARIGAMIAMAVAARGMDPGELCRAAGFDPSQANDPLARISLAVEQALWESAATYTGDPEFGHFVD